MAERATKPHAAGMPSDPSYLGDENGSWLKRYGGRRVALMTLFVLCLLVIAPQRVSLPDTPRPGEFAKESVIADVAFDVIDREATEKARVRAAKAAPYVYRVDDQLVQDRVQVLATILDQVGEIAAKDVLSPDERRRLIALSVRPTISEETVDLLIQPENFELLENGSLRLAAAQLSNGVFGEQPILVPSVELIADGEPRLMHRDEVPRQATAISALGEACQQEAADNVVLASALFELSSTAIGPTVRFDEAATAQRKALAENAVPDVMRTIHRNELIIQAGHQVTTQEVDILLKYQQVLHRGGLVKTLIGHALALSVLIVCGIFLIRATRRDLTARARTVWIMVFNVVMVVGTARLLTLTPVATEFRMLVPVALCGVMLAVLFDRFTAVAVSLLSALVVSLMPEYGSGFLLQQISCTVIGVYTMGRVTKRGDLWRPGAVVALCSAILSLAIGLSQDADPRGIATMAAIGLGNGAIIAVFAPGLLMPMERLSRITTDITLLEFCDLKHPLLVRMQREAPGTFHHSLTMATLAESAAEMVGANPLLCRVGCYFHDIGKMVQPEYFAENQSGQNAHDRITPERSSKILSAHVEEGLALGREYGLSEPILAFIPEHQGTAIKIHFYKKAVEQAEDGDDVNENDYRYPGPRPQSKETAICMLADGCEAASRSLDNPTAERLAELVRKITRNKLLDGQLDDSDLTLREINRIEDTFTRVLAAMLHTRVKYPDEQTPEEIKEKVAGPRTQSERTPGAPAPASFRNA